MTRESAGVTMASAPDDESRFEMISAALYMVGAYLILVPLADVSVALITPRISDPMFRFGALGNVSRGMAFPVIGLAIMLATATRFAHRTVRQVFMWLSLVLFIATVIALPMHLLDTLQARALVPGDKHREFHIAAAMNLFRLLFAAACLIVEFLASMKVGKWDRPIDADRHNKRKSAAKGLVLQQNKGLKVPTMGEETTV